MLHHCTVCNGGEHRTAAHSAMLSFGTTVRFALWSHASLFILTKSYRFGEVAYNSARWALLACAPVAAPDRRAAGMSTIRHMHRFALEARQYVPCPSVRVHAPYYRRMQLCRHWRHQIDAQRSRARFIICIKFISEVRSMYQKQALGMVVVGAPPVRPVQGCCYY